MHFKVMLGAICVAEYDADEAIPAYRIDPEYVGPQYVTIDETGAVASIRVSRHIWSRLEFLRRFSTQERLSIRATAKSDPVIEDFMALLDAAESVDSDNADVSAGLSYMVSAGLLSEARAAQIMGD